jgi:hypothetical protein
MLRALFSLPSRRIFSWWTISHSLDQLRDKHISKFLCLTLVTLVEYIHGSQSIDVLLQSRMRKLHTVPKTVPQVFQV